MTRNANDEIFRIDKNRSVAKGRDAIMLRLLDSCVRKFDKQGLKKLFIDGMKGGDEGFQSMGQLETLPSKRG